MIELKPENSLPYPQMRYTFERVDSYRFFAVESTGNHLESRALADYLKKLVSVEIRTYTYVAV